MKKRFTFDKEKFLGRIGEKGKESEDMESPTIKEDHHQSSKRGSINSPHKEKELDL